MKIRLSENLLSRSSVEFRINKKLNLSGDKFLSVLKVPLSGQKSFKSLQSLACWYNCKIAGQETEDYRNFDVADVKTFCPIYDRLSAAGIATPKELYRQGILEYLK